MSLWWVSRDELDANQINLIERLSLQKSYLVLGPPGCGKTNVLLRRAQFVRGQNMPNVMVLTFTRPLAEFVKTGCIDARGRQIFPPSCISTIESWLRSLYGLHGVDLPERSGSLIEWKRRLAQGAMPFAGSKRAPMYDAFFVDEAQDLLEEEVALMAAWSGTQFFVGDDRQRIYRDADGLDPVRKLIPTEDERVLTYHYRLAPQICRMADRILVPDGGQKLESTCHYKGPTPASVNVESAAQTKIEQLDTVLERVRQQVRVYRDLLDRGDRIGIIVARTGDRDVVLEHLSKDPDLARMLQVVRAREPDERGYQPAFEPGRPVCILTVKGCKGLEFRAVHWPFADELDHYHQHEDYYTVVTRAKTSIDIYWTKFVPEALARAHAPEGVTPW